jgi:hypothetical protein
MLINQGEHVRPQVYINLHVKSMQEISQKTGLLSEAQLIEYCTIAGQILLM